MTSVWHTNSQYRGTRPALSLDPVEVVAHASLPCWLPAFVGGSNRTERSHTHGGP
jgi:hypothetical protein